MTDSPLNAWLEHDEQILRLQLARPKANIIDAEMIDALSSALHGHSGDERLLAVILDAKGPHFSFGASVEEHLPEQCAGMLRKINSLIMQIIRYPVPVIAAVQGQCLGGGLEVVCAASPIFATPDAQLGQPEISLAVIAPAASCLLPERVGQAQAEMLLLSGESIDALHARKIGLIDEISESPSDAALTWVERYLIGKSASSVRFAVQAARLDYVERIATKLDLVEKMYIEELMQTKDPVEGLNAFLEKRKPVWENYAEGAEQ